VEGIIRTGLLPRSLVSRLAGRGEHGHVGGLFGRSHQVQTNFGDALPAHPKYAGGAVGKVDDPFERHRAAVVDPDQNPPTVAKIRHLHPAS